MTRGLSFLWDLLCGSVEEYGRWVALAFCVGFPMCVPCVLNRLFLEMGELLLVLEEHLLGLL